MALAPISRLKKKDIIWLANHYCKHGHTFLEHYNCYLQENPFKGRIGYFDIETTNLAADYGIMLCYCIKDSNSDKIYSALITKEDLNKDLDNRIVRQCIKDLKNFDRIITFYGKRFDVPFLRSRAVSMDIPFPNYAELYHDDVYFIIRHRFRLSSNRLENSCRTLLGKSEKTHIEPTRWIRALQGSKKDLLWILNHCQRDVRDLEKLYKKVVDFSRHQDSSI